MKKIMACILGIVMTISIAVPASAATKLNIEHIGVPSLKSAETKGMFMTVYASAMHESSDEFTDSTTGDSIPVYISDVPVSVVLDRGFDSLTGSNNGDYVTKFAVNSLNITDTTFGVLQENPVIAEGKVVVENEESGENEIHDYAEYLKNSGKYGPTQLVSGAKLYLNKPGVYYVYTECNYTTADNSAVVIEITDKAGNVPTAETDTTTHEYNMPFKDVMDIDWFASGVYYVYTNNIIGGVTPVKFAPRKNITRGEIVLALWKMAGCPEVKTIHTFSDISRESAYCKAANWAYTNNIIKGVTETKFNPAATLTRQQFASILYRCAEYYNLYIQMESNKIEKFNDYNRVSEYAKEGLNWCCSANIIQGDGNMINPNQATTRAQAAVFISRFANLVK